MYLLGIIMSTKSDEITFSIVPVSDMPSIQRGTNQKYTKIVEAAKKLGVTETIKIPLTDKTGETNRNAIQTLNNHVKELKKVIKGITYQMYVSSRNLGTKDKPNVFAFIFYEKVEANDTGGVTDNVAPTPSTA
jgi:hypothetical protein